MNSALIVTSAKSALPAFNEMLNAAGIYNITIAACASEAKRLLIENDFDLCLINSPLSDESGEELAIDVSVSLSSEVILIVKSDYFEEICDKVEDFGVITVSKPVSKGLFWNALRLCQATHKRIMSMQTKNSQLLEKIEDIRIIDRAKCILISNFSMTEAEAHKYIEKQAMNMRLTKRAAAEGILKTYENR